MTLPALDLVMFAATGALTGMLGALLGLGGGVFLVPLLALGFHLEPRTAVAASLVAVIASSSSTTIVNMKRGLVNVPLAFTLLLLTSIGSHAGADIASYISTRSLYAIFAATLFVVAIVVRSSVDASASVSIVCMPIVGVTTPVTIVSSVAGCWPTPW